jgi:hypothetical protein
LTEVRIEREFLFVRRAFGNGTESTAARAEIAENHESRGAAVETFVHIGAAGRFADGVEIQAAEPGLERVYLLEMSRSLAQPFRKTGLRGRTRFELNERIERQFSIFS